MRRSLHPVSLTGAATTAATMATTMETTMATTTLASVATQTDSCCFTDFGFGREREKPRLPCSRNSYCVDQPLSRLYQLEAMDRKWLFDYNAIPGENGEAGETTYEEITLHRYNKEAKFGMTLWYETGNDEYDEPRKETKVYIGEIDPGGIAARDGRARIGDRISEINGERVESRDQVLQLLRTDLPFIRMLLSRSCPVQPDDGFTDDLQALECLSFEDNGGHCAVPLECIDEEDDATDDTGTTNENDSQRQDSGVGKTDESTRNEESSEQEALDEGVLSPLMEVEGSSLFRSCHEKSNESFASIDWHDSDPDAPHDQLPSIFQCQQFYEMLKERCNADLAACWGGRTSKTRAVAAMATNRKYPTTCDDYAVLERPRSCDDVALVGRQVAALQLERRSPQSRTESSRTVNATARRVPRMGTRVELIRHPNPFGATNWTDAGESIPGRNLTVAHANVHSQAEESRVRTIVGTRPNPETVVGSDPLGPLMNPDLMNSDLMNLDTKNPGDTSRKTRESQMCQTDDEGEYESLVPLAYRFSGSVMPCRCYQCLMALQLQDLEEKNPCQHHPSIDLQRRNTHGKEMGRNSGDATVPSSPPRAEETANNTSAGKTTVELEWVVKRRADGSRYITRRPVRNRLLKERARRVEEERACQTTTDDDTASALKTGRYWTREDRRRHMEKSRMRRREKEEAARQRTFEVGGSNPGIGEDQPCIVQLSRRKMMKSKGKKVLDNFTTLQELMAHGSRDSYQGQTFNHLGLLSVTTV